MPGFLDRIDESPGLLDLIAAGKERSVTAHRVEQQTLVRFRAGFSERRSIMEIHFHRLDVKARAGDLCMHPQRDSLIRLNSNNEHIEVMQIFVKQHRRRFFEMNGNFSGRFGKPFPDAHINRNVGPSPVADEQTQGDESLGLRIWVDVFFLAITGHWVAVDRAFRSEEHTSELQSPMY